MKIIIKISIILLSVLTLNSRPVFSQLKVENDGSIYVNSYQGNYGRANWTKVHYQYSCAYHLWNTYYGGDVFYVRGDGNVWTRYGFLVASDSIFKKNIQTINSPLSKIMNLRGVKYNRKYLINTSVPTDPDLLPSSGLTKNVTEQKLEPSEYGLIAQEVEKVVPEAVKTMHDSTKAISYTSLVPILIEAIKDQQVQIETLQQIISKHEEEILGLKDCCETKDTTLKSASIETGITEANDFKDALLFQNTPNPFTMDTEIRYSIPENSKNAKIYIHNLQGNEIKSYILHNTGINSITISGSVLRPGLYIYTLVVNNAIIDSKRMLLTKN